MKKYIFMRILRSLVSIFMVTTLTYTIIYTMVPRKLIFKQDFYRYAYASLAGQHGHLLPRRENPFF